LPSIAFEYERQTEAYLRLAVMFAKPGVDRPEFMIIERATTRPVAERSTLLACGCPA